MKSLFVALFFSLLASVASAQTWYATPNTRPLVESNYNHIAQLPLSVTFDWVAPAPWTTVNGATWNAIWPRNAVGAWYRMNAYTQPSIYRDPVYSWPYTCRVLGAGFSCLDTARQITRNISCPTTIAIGPLKMWRSTYNPAWHEYGLFTVNMGPFGATTGRTVAFQSALVTANGRRINCLYGPLTGQGPGLTTDIWGWRWDR